MKIRDEPTNLTIEAVTKSWNERAIKANPEYQRGRAWTERQGQMLVDSVFRGYPLPRFYFHQKRVVDALGNESVVLDVIDGQQRIMALTNFRNDYWGLFDPSDGKVALPQAIRKLGAPWAKKTFSSLHPDLQKQFLTTTLPCVIIEEFGSPEEVRDLFIRLQAGTALTRQQVRDAWPGNLGPFIETLAGKMQRKPQFTLFSAVDRRGSAGAEDDADDPYQSHRQTCAQSMCIFLRRRRDGQIPSVSAANLDAMYHQFTDFDTAGHEADLFRELLQYLEKIVDGRPTTTVGKKSKITKWDLFALTIALQDLMAGKSVAIEKEIPELTRVAWKETFEPPPRGGKVVSETAIGTYYRWFLTEKLFNAKLTGLDKKRLFDAEQKKAIWEAAVGKCGICQKPITQGLEEYDHVIPWLKGGRTETGNGRPVHEECHLRGIQALTVLTTAAPSA